MIKNKITLFIGLTVLLLFIKANASEEIIKRKMHIEISEYQTAKDVKDGISVSLKLQDSGEKLITGSLIIENEKRVAELTVKGELKNHVLHFTFTDSTSGAKGHGVIFGNNEKTLKIKFIEFSNYGDGSTASLFTTHLIEKKPKKEKPAKGKNK